MVEISYVDPDISDVSGFLYTRDTREPLCSGSNHVSEPMEDWPSVATWLRRVEDDFQAMQNSLVAERPVWSAVAFHAHEGVEKLLKALLLREAVRPDWTHSLGDLITQLPLHIANDERLLSACAVLDRLYSRSRYPNEEKDLPPTEVEARKAAAAALLARSIVLPRIVRET